MTQIHEKQKELPEDVGDDFSKAESFHRMHAAFERDITALGKQVEHKRTALCSEATQQAAAERFTLMIVSDTARECCNVSATVKG